MVVVEIPGRESLALEHAVFDLNGTLALDGRLIPGVEELFAAVARRLRCVILTGDTFGTGASLARTLDCPLEIVATGADKERIVGGLEGQAVAVGNGENDVAMLARAALGMAVLGPEGTSARALMAADLVVPDILCGLRLLLSPARLTATLRP